MIHPKSTSRSLAQAALEQIKDHPVIAGTVGSVVLTPILGPVVLCSTFTKSELWLIPLNVTSKAAKLAPHRARPPSRAGQGLSDAPPTAPAEPDPSCNQPRGVPETPPATAFIRLRPHGGTRAEGNPKTSLQAVDPDRVDEGPGGAGLARRRGARARDRRSALVRSSAEPLVGRGRAGDSMAAPWDYH
ncbi:uncharacterized protein SCHCODRAFT_02693022 [Schizophyllum commune H4-8]|nr:uncharacterized protein SCHCODRAFT_02693022 [Schizophyllum commune H4-8]KAI5887279.1 hypothetical protein SCHCODRAFT_02693022 [Schizophyllum commune H4-8]